MLMGLGCLIRPASGWERMEKPVPRVLILFSNDRLLPANQRYEEGIRKTLDPEGNQMGVSIFGEFMDVPRLNGTESEEALEEYLRRRYRNLPPHVVVALAPEAFQFLRERRSSLFPDVPLILGGSSMEELLAVGPVDGVAGLPMEVKLTPVVEALLVMRPQTREIVLVHGSSALDRSLRDNAVKQCSIFAGRLKVTDFPELPLDELKARLAELPEEKAVFYLTYFQGPGGDTYIPARVAQVIAQASSVPVVGVYDTYIGSGVLGVKALPFEKEGMELGKVIRRVLAGEKAEAIGMLPNLETRLILDARQVKRWGIRSVPAGAELRYRNPTLWEEHRGGIIVIILIVSLQGLMIVRLIRSRRRQKRAETELRLSEARFSGIFRGSPAAISIVRKSDGRIMDVNPGWEVATAVSREDAIGRTPLEAGFVVDGDAALRFRLFLESGKPLQDFDQIHRTPDGRLRVLSLSTEEITLQDELCYVVVAKDVTEPRAEEHARQQMAQTSRLAMLGEMTASIAHEINQPLGAILSNAEAAEMLMQRDQPPWEEVRQILKDIRQDDIRASEVIKRVRALVGRREVRRVVLDLNAVVLGSLQLVRHEALRRGVTLSHELAQGLPEIQADAVQLEQVVLNLLLNGMDAMKETPVALRKLILRSLRKSGDCVMVSVQDNGHGIPPDKLERVFDSFFTTKEGGMGLGLALARSIAEAYKGSIFAENNASGGSTFHFILPISHEG